jgi:hypothetical protein
MLKSQQGQNGQEDQEAQLVDLQNIPEINSTEEFILLDSWPSVERTPKDNVWKQAGSS